MDKEIATLRDYSRMCESYGLCHSSRNGECPLWALRDCDEECTHYILNHPDEANESILKWVTEHPEKTYAMDFFEKFPNAPTDSDGTPRITRCNVYGKESCNGRTCDECWNEPMEV